MEVQLCVKVLLPSPVKLLKCYITTKTYPYGSVRAEAPLKGQSNLAETAASPPNKFEFLLFCQDRAVRRTFSCSSLCWLQQLIIDQPVVWTCTLLQHQSSGNIGVLMVLFVKKALTSGCRQYSGIILDLQNHPFLTGRRQSNSKLPEKVGSADSSRSDSSRSDSWSGFYPGSGWGLSAITDWNHPCEMLNEGKLDLFVYHMMCHMMQEEDPQLRKLAGVPGRRDVGWDWKLNDPPLNYYIKPLTTKQLLIICERLLRGW